MNPRLSMWIAASVLCAIALLGLLWSNVFADVNQTPDETPPATRQMVWSWNIPAPTRTPSPQNPICDCSVKGMFNPTPTPTPRIRICDCILQQVATRTPTPTPRVLATSAPDSGN